MRTYNTIDEIKADLDDNNDLIITDDIEIRIDVPDGVIRNLKAGDIRAKDIRADGDLTAWDITAKDIRADGDLTADNILAGDITAWDILAGDITAKDILARRDITAGNITAKDIRADGDLTAGDITAKDITAGNISYYAFCICYDSCTCASVNGRRIKALHVQCLDGSLTVKDNERSE